MIDWHRDSSTVHVYSVDRELWEALGLPAYGHRADDGWIDLGSVDAPMRHTRPWATVRIEVCQLPAHFWRFTIEPLVEDVHAVVLATGSGVLSEYWPSVELFAGGLLHAKAAS